MKKKNLKHNELRSMTNNKINSKKAIWKKNKWEIKFCNGEELVILLLNKTAINEGDIRKFSIHQESFKEVNLITKNWRQNEKRNVSCLVLTGAAKIRSINPLLEQKQVPISKRLLWFAKRVHSVGNRPKPDNFF